MSRRGCRGARMLLTQLRRVTRSKFNIESKRASSGTLAARPNKVRRIPSVVSHRMARNSTNWVRLPC